MDMKKDTSKMIGEYLLNNRINITNVCKKSGISYYDLSQILSGRKKLLADEYILICNALNVPLDMFKLK